MKKYRIKKCRYKGRKVTRKNKPQMLILQCPRQYNPKVNPVKVTMNTTAALECIIRQVLARNIRWFMHKKHFPSQKFSPVYKTILQRYD